MKRSFWIILIVVLVLLILFFVVLPIIQGIFAYQNLKSEGFVVERAVVNQPFSVSSFEISEELIWLDLENEAEEAVTVESLSVDNCGEYKGEILISSATNKRILVSCETILEDKYFSSDIVVKYRQGDSSLSLTSTGIIQGKVE